MDNTQIATLVAQWHQTLAVSACIAAALSAPTLIAVIADRLRK